MSGMLPAIKLIASQLNALKVGDNLLLDFVQVLNQTSLRRDDVEESAGQEVDRSYWDAKVGDIMQIVDGVLGIVNELTTQPFQLIYTKSHIGVAEPGNWRRLLFVKPKHKFAHLDINMNNFGDWISRGEEAGLPIVKKGPRLRVTVSPRQFREQENLLKELIPDALKQYQSVV